MFIYKELKYNFIQLNYEIKKEKQKLLFYLANFLVLTSTFKIKK